ncbi:DUF4340 domain-containing protein [Borrelia miyamotoi]|uniref:DUF4340 domain-containing protein n=1 Tax=Borrelia miyamotoi TaxID=47466 RepID=A0AAQ2WWG3_9SPIR|nr:DUF4340 domain-containing protein [Borrelia miyamotoi]AGT27695.1 N-acetylglucosamine-6-phosphate deacetylase [Borrelia miyamotoi LB-2001]AJA58849.1 N-acetylglucosamine-6-phosphate deacetylase [Borrelia miyamotoi]AOW95938.1 N-acetylglucosamine-6-phosphate deacetylase [Borrelia miyamotoi]QTL83829.1 DUF4340 domain-containing protein [Borrelia miyamotoi]WAZ84864.1 DUF4340 domain-containing protein [Borrelia miyamotoi]
MDNKKTFLGTKENIKIAIIIILISTFLLGIIFSNQNKVARLFEEKFFEIELNKIAKIETELEGTIKKSGKIWELKYNDINLPINEKRINSMIQDLEKLQKNKLVSKDPKKHKELGIKEKPDFKFFDDKNNLLTEIFIGNSGEGDSRLSYIKGSDKNVYLTNNIFLSYKGNSYNTFANTKLFEAKNTKIEHLSFKIINKPKKDEEDAIQNDYNVSMKDGLYFFNQEVLRKEKILQMIQEFITDGLEIDKTKIKDYKLQYNVEIKWDNKSMNNIDIYFNKNEKNRDILMKKDNDAYYYTTNKWTFFEVFNLEKKINTKDDAPNEDHLKDNNDHHH